MSAPTDDVVTLTPDQLGDLLAWAWSAGWARGRHPVAEQDRPDRRDLAEQPPDDGPNRNPYRPTSVQAALAALPDADSAEAEWPAIQEEPVAFHHVQRCALCGEIPNGSGRDGALALCHPLMNDGPDCYHLWTVYALRRPVPQTLAQEVALAQPGALRAWVELQHESIPDPAAMRP